jgi:gas vesicle protein
MNSFFKGILLGVGVGLLVAPMRGEEMRRLLGERVNELQGYLPENDQVAMYRQQVSDRLNQTAGTLKDYAQQAATTMKQTAGTLSDVAQNAASTVRSTSSDVAQTTKDAVKNTSNSATV